MGIISRILDVKDILYEAMVWIYMVLHRGRVAGCLEGVN